ncbi:hypothetical protein [Candidatus Methylomirabilis sp.]|uniref:Uncharacterized protein n=1 Tax=Candidatus Methylomirabilis tolerans TaxID=3123416 RepID=A0AAJ1AJ23_9BACT|nr:hypothetical protein [Candidatus Methylomirabilis sp.]
MNKLNHHSHAFRHCGRGKAVSDPRDRIEDQPAQGDQIVSIIEYSTEKKARSSYPFKIVSPPIPSQCCATRMNRIGQAQVDGDRTFYYKRCSRCGFTVREFMSAIDIERLLSVGVSASDHTERWLDQIQREVQSDIAA